MIKSATYFGGSRHYDKKYRRLSGSFNPITNGHTDLVEQPTPFRPHYLAIGTSAQKDPKVALADRIDLCQDVQNNMATSFCGGFNTLLVDYVSSKGARFILRGLRAVTDFDYEFQMAEITLVGAPYRIRFSPTSKDCSLSRQQCARSRLWAAIFLNLCIPRS